jgi:hypothetical protein
MNIDWWAPEGRHVGRQGLDGRRGCSNGHSAGTSGKSPSDNKEPQCVAQHMPDIITPHVAQQVMNR